MLNLAPAQGLGSRYYPGGLGHKLRHLQATPHTRPPLIMAIVGMIYRFFIIARDMEYSSEDSIDKPKNEDL